MSVNHRTLDIDGRTFHIHFGSGVNPDVWVTFERGGRSRSYKADWFAFKSFLESPLPYGCTRSEWLSENVRSWTAPEDWRTCITRTGQKVEMYRAAA